MLYKFLFPSKPDGAATSAILLIVRIIFGMLLMNHGIEKWSNYQELSAVFPDPLGVGIYHWFPLPSGYAADDIYNGDGILCYSRKRSVCGQRTGFHISGGIRTDVYYRSRKVCRRPLVR